MIKRTKTLRLSLKGILLIFLAPLLVQAQQEKQAYYFNKAPLKQDVYVQLPLGSIKAKGWLLKQLELQKEGFTGHAEELYPEDDNLGKNSDWLGGTGNGWEKVPYYLKGLVALAYTLDDQELKTKAKKWIDYTLDHQQESGLFGPPKMNDWWPRMPFMYAVQSYYEATGDKRVIPFFSKYFRYQMANLDRAPLESWGKSRAGDNIELVLWLYNRTGEPFLIDLAKKLKAQAYPWADIYNKNEFFYFGDDYQPKHMVNVAQALKFTPLYSQIDQHPYYTDAMQNGIDHILRDNGEPQGMASGTEFMSGKSSVQGVETCTVVEWMQSLETAYRILHDANIGDQLEKVAFNALPAQFSKDLKNHSYYTLPNEVQSVDGPHGFNQDYSSGIVFSPYSGFPCCRYNLHMGWPYFVKNSWLATPDKGLAVNAYGPMEIHATVAGNVAVSVTEDTNYPFEEEITMQVSPEKTTTFPIRFRIPGWCRTPEVKVNGKVQAGVEAGKFFTLNRKWRKGDRVSLHFPMHVVLQPQVNNGVSVARGPLVYALKIEEDQKVTKEFPVKGFYETEIRPASAWNYALSLEDKTAGEAFELVQGKMPANPFVQTETPVRLKTMAKKVPFWTLNERKTAAFDVPFSPVSLQTPEEEITLVPYGAESLRLSIFPVAGPEAYIHTSYKEDFDENLAKGFVVYGGGWFCRDKAYHCASNGGQSSGTMGSKTILNGTRFKDFIYRAQVAVNTPGNAGLVFRVSDPAIGSEAYQGYYLGLNPEKGSVEFGKSSGGAWKVIASAPYPIQLHKLYELKVKAAADQFEIYINGDAQPLISAADGEFSEGSIGLRAYRALATIDNLEISALK